MGSTPGGMAVLGRADAACCLVLLFAVAVTGDVRENIVGGADDTLLADLSVDQFQDPDMDGEIFHSDTAHMSKEDVDRASKVYDILFPSHDGATDLGESTETWTESLAEAEKGLNSARKQRRQATKKLLSAKSVAATKKAQKQLKLANKSVTKAKLKVVGKKNFAKLQEKKAVSKLKKEKRKAKKARKKILKAKGLKATMKAEKKFAKAMKKVKKDKRKVASMGTKLLKKSSSKIKNKLMKKSMKKAVLKSKLKKKISALKLRKH